ncbi:MAG: 8-oxo-dGTP diphosphatase [Patescibacteria group bacterium]|jgi:mutator protein MutT
MRQITTLSIIEDGNKTLLAMKKRGSGEGWWNGYGGKVQEGEAIEEAMVRELQEESGIIAKVFKERAVIEFFFDGTDEEVEMHIFEVTEYEGQPKETEEMAPKWFLKEEIPYDNMWPADRNWMPLFFEGKDFDGRAVFDGETKSFIESDFHVREIDPELSDIGTRDKLF